MSVAQMFEDFCGQLVLLRTLRSSISTRTGRVVGRLNSDFRSLSSDTANRFYAGSYGRSTAVPGFSDIDLICVLPYETYVQYNAYAGNKQSSLLQAVRTSLNSTYPNSAVIADGQSVKIKFKDNITYEIVPVFVNKDGSYTYADSNVLATVPLAALTNAPPPRRSASTTQRRARFAFVRVRSEAKSAKHPPHHRRRAGVGYRGRPDGGPPPCRSGA